MRVDWLRLPDHLASARYRQIIPMRELGAMDVEIGSGDILIASKHGYAPEVLPPHRKLVFDVCDDHFDGAWGVHYRLMIDRADAVTCNSDAMRFRIYQATGRVATVIVDPYEFEEVAPSWGEGLLWFGHRSNLPDLERVRPEICHLPLTIVCDGQGGTLAYSKETLLNELAKCAVVILPTGKSPCKSANRMIEAIRRGKFVAATPLPAYEAFPAFVGELRERIDFAFENRGWALKCVADAQERIRRDYKPSVVACDWYSLLSKVDRGAS